MKPEEQSREHSTIAGDHPVLAVVVFAALVIIISILVSSLGGSSDEKKEPSAAVADTSAVSEVTSPSAASSVDSGRSDSQTGSSVDPYKIVAEFDFREAVKEWPDIQSIGAYTMLNIYRYMESEWEKVPQNISREQENKEGARIAEQAARKYCVAADEAELVRGFVSMHYDIVSSAAGYDKTAVVDLTVPHGTVLKSAAFGSTLDIFVKIEGLLSDSTTVTQNYFNVFDLIQNQGADVYTLIYYTGYMPAQGGGNTEVIMFSVPLSTIEAIKNGTISEIELCDYVDDLWIHPQLQN